MRGVLMVSIAGLALAGCDQLQQGNLESDLIGSWTCSESDDEGTAKIEMQYASGGRSSAQFNMTMNDNGSTVEFTGSGSGTWELDGDKLTEEVTKFTIIGMKVNGRPVNDPAFKQNLENAMVDQITTSTIKSVDDDSLFLKSASGPVSCSREG